MTSLEEATALFDAGQRDAARALLLGCLQSESSPAPQRLRAWLLLAAVHEQDGDRAQVIEAAGHAQALARQLDDKAAEAEALCQQAAACLQLGLHRDGIESAAAGLARAREAGNGRIEAMALKVMSNQALHQGDEDEAQRLLEQSLACARRCGDEHGEFWALNNLSHLMGLRAARLAEAGDRERTRAAVAELVQAVQAARQVAERTGQLLHRAFAVANLADAYIVNGDHERARELVREYADISRAQGFGRLLAYANLDELRLLRAEGRLDEAVAVVDNDQHRQLLKGQDDIALDTESALYELHKAAGRFEAALRHHENTSRMNLERLARKAQQQVSAMMARMDLEQARAAAERARLDAELAAQRAQVAELEREQMRRVAHEDPLTGIGNRRAADEALALRLADARTAGALCAVMVDVDHFKRINDTHGHGIGDAVLRELGGLMRLGLRASDQVFRYGGEEFLLMLHAPSEGSALEVCERLRVAIERHDWSAIAPGLAVTASFGLAPATAAEPAEQLVRRADRALYAAKHGGRNRVTQG